MACPGTNNAQPPGEGKIDYTMCVATTASYTGPPSPRPPARSPRPPPHVNITAAQPAPVDDSNTHTGSYESDFRLLKTDLVASFNQWRRHRTFRVEDFTNGRGGAGDGGEDGEGEGGGGRSEYGLARAKEIRYHTYEVGACFMFLAFGFCLEPWYTFICACQTLALPRLAVYGNDLYIQIGVVDQRLLV